MADDPDYLCALAASSLVTKVAAAQEVCLGASRALR